VDAFHERLARLGLEAGGSYGLALAGGYAIQALGMLDRPSEDVDLFTAWNRRGEFEGAVQAVVEAYGTAGLDVVVDKRYETFARLLVTDARSGEFSKVELAVDYRANEPVLMAVGPVLHPDDAVANKMGALFGRVEARDFIDVDAAVRSGQYSRERLLVLAAQADSGFDRSMFAEAIAQIDLIGAGDFARYGVTGSALDGLRARFADWRAELGG
jgi:hypothetical protein